MSIFTVAKTLITLLPVITDVLVSVEEMNKEGGNGSYKKELALSLIKTIYNASEPAVSYDTLYNNISATVDAVVSFLNSTGKFVKALKQAA